MRNLSFNGFKYDKKYLYAFILTVIAAFICGIVLCIIVDSSIYFNKFAQNYVYFVYNFKNGKLIFSHVLSEVLYLYAVFLIAYFCKIRYFTLIIVFLKSVFFGLYTCILFTVSSFGGAMVAIFVFIPTSLVSLALCYCAAQFCKCFKNISFIIPIIFAVADTVVLLILVNLVFRLVIIIV